MHKKANDYDLLLVFSAFKVMLVKSVLITGDHLFLVPCVIHIWVSQYWPFCHFVLIKLSKFQWLFFIF